VSMSLKKTDSVWELKKEEEKVEVLEEEVKNRQNQPKKQWGRGFNYMESPTKPRGKRGCPVRYRVIQNNRREKVWKVNVKQKCGAESNQGGFREIIEGKPDTRGTHESQTGNAAWLRSVGFKGRVSTHGQGKNKKQPHQMGKNAWGANA